MARRKRREERFITTPFGELTPKGTSSLTDEGCAARAFIDRRNSESAPNPAPRNATTQRRQMLAKSMRSGTFDEGLRDSTNEFDAPSQRR